MYSLLAAFVLARPSDPVQNESTTHDTMNIVASHAVNFVRTSAVEAPNIELESPPPKVAPSPEDLLSCISTTRQSNSATTMKVIIAK